MFEKFMTGNAEGFRQRYEGTYGFFRKENGTRLLSKLTAINERVCTFVDSQGVEYRLNADVEKDIGFEFLPPKNCYHNTSTGAYLVQRVPARQYQRGISPKNTAIYHLTTSHQQARMDFPTLEKVYGTENLKLDVEALWKKMLANELSFALSKQFAMANGYLYMFGEPVGHYSQVKDTLTFKLLDPTLWKTEVSDALKYLGKRAEVN